jgi:hypothetical protein
MPGEAGICFRPIPVRHQPLRACAWVHSRARAIASKLAPTQGAGATLNPRGDLRQARQSSIAATRLTRSPHANAVGLGAPLSVMIGPARADCGAASP